MIQTTAQAISTATTVLEAGGVILYPADTIWGIGCDATNLKAIQKVYEIKSRNPDKPLIVLVSDLQQLYQVVGTVHVRIDNLLHYNERPLTIVYPKTTDTYRHLAAPDGTLGVRLVRSGFCHDLLTAYGRPLTSTSANKEGEPAPAYFRHINSEIIRAVDYTVPAFAEEGITGNPSVIARYNDDGELDFLRQALP